jgi:predicted NBD/HSP70 family sugar kinase
MTERANRQMVLSADIGGSHITAALVDANTGELLQHSIQRKDVSSGEHAGLILQQWSAALSAAMAGQEGHSIKGIGIAIPGPFNYAEGISLMKGNNKYEQLYGINLEQALRAELNIDASIPIRFENDAACFGLGESLQPENRSYERMIAVTLGTGFGSTFLAGNKLVNQGKGVPPDGELYNMPYLGVSCEDYISGRWILAAYNKRAEEPADSVFTIAKRVQNKDGHAARVFEEFGYHLAGCLHSWINAFNAGSIVIGGSIAKSADLFLPAFRQQLAVHKASLPVRISQSMELAAIRGAASVVLDAG